MLNELRIICLKVKRHLGGICSDATIAQRTFANTKKQAGTLASITQSMDAMIPTLADAFTGTPSERIRRQLDEMAGKS